MVAFFSKGCDSREMFSDLKIAEESCFEKNLNKFNVLSVDLGAAFNTVENRNDVLKYLRKEFLEDFRKEFPSIGFSDEDSIAKMILRVYAETKTQFIIIIDEYDTLIRERQNESLL